MGWAGPRRAKDAPAKWHPHHPASSPSAPASVPLTGTCLLWGQLLAEEGGDEAGCREGTGPGFPGPRGQPAPGPDRGLLTSGVDSGTH